MTPNPKRLNPIIAALSGWKDIAMRPIPLRTSDTELTGRIGDAHNYLPIPDYTFDWNAIHMAVAFQPHEMRNAIQKRLIDTAFTRGVLTIDLEPLDWCNAFLDCQRSTT